MCFHMVRLILILLPYNRVKISQVAPRKKFPMFWRSGGIVEMKTLKDQPLLV